VIAEPAVDVGILAFNLVAPVLAERPYCHSYDYCQVYFDIRDELDAAEFPVRMAAQKLIVEQLHK